MTLAGLSACGGASRAPAAPAVSSAAPTSSPPGAAGPVACEVLTAADAETILGVPVEPEPGAAPKLVGGAWTSVCAFSADGEKLVRLLLKVPVDDEGRRGNDRIFELAGRMFVTRPVSGYGARALFIDETGMLYVQTADDWYLTFTAGARKATPDANLAGAKALADLVLPRL
jgi:hypothetical protein